MAQNAIQRLKRPPLGASVAALCGIGILCGLGTWQLERLQEKEALLHRLEAQTKAPAMELHFQDFTDDKNIYRHGKLYGRYLADKSVLLIPRTYNGAPGGHLYTPLRLPGGEIVMVNRGWVPDGYDTAKFLAGPPNVQAVGEIINLPQPNRFTPDNPSISTEPREWYRLDNVALKTLLGEKTRIAPLMLRRTSAPGKVGNLTDAAATGKDIPVTEATKPHINNNHASYAAFWYGMALVLAVIFFLRFILLTKRPQ